ncbi:glycosyltransferase family 2 protein [Piromyces sp. E2]|nr:glycosyltransferase family 2 protein [Piromyces sp. E2]|eukprot:OUM68726.1 glycosyltransferase family 2 protein [Piromyces sp. E2]
MKQLQEDVLEIENLSEQNILEFLKTRHAQRKYFTNLGSNALIYLNPYNEDDCISDHNSKVYVEDSRNSSNERPKLSSSIFQLVNSTYLHMIREKEDQSIIINGECSSGKTEIYKAIARHLCHLTRETKKKTVTQSAILKINKILDSFGTATTLNNPSSSRFGKYIEYQFDRTGKIIGAKLVHYCLEKDRVSRVPEDERNFNVFYHFLASASSNEKSTLDLSDPSGFEFLSQNRYYKRCTNDDNLDGRELRSALKSFGIGVRQQAQIFQLLAAILHLGNIEFIDGPKNAHQDTCDIKNFELVEFIAELLGVTPDALDSILTYQTKCIRSDVFTEYLNAEAASRQRDKLANTLYSLIFDWVIEKINSKLCRDDESDNFIGVVDLFGFQNGKSNQFNQFIANFSAEKMQFFTNKCFFDIPVFKYQEEGIAIETPPYTNNTSTIKLLDGIISTMEAEGNQKDCTNVSLRERLNKEFLSNYEYTRLNSGFGIRHFNTQVSYDLSQFVEKNNDCIQPDIITLVRGGPKSKASTNIFLRSLFSEKAVSVTRHPTQYNTIVRANSTLPRRTPSVKHATGELIKNRDNKSNNYCTVAKQFSNSLTTLSESLFNTQSWFVFCITPNYDFVSDNFDTKLVSKQLRNFNIPNIAQLRSRNNEVKSYPLDDFCNLYNDLMRETNIKTDNPEHACRELSHVFGFDEKDINVGRNQVFLSEYAWRFLEDARLEGGNVMDDEYEDEEDVTYGEDEVESEMDSEYEAAAREIEEEEHEKEIIEAKKPQMKMKKPITASKEMSKGRKWWLCLTYSSTWCYCPFCLSTCGKMKRKDVQIAWREKVTINIIILFLCALILFYIIGLGRLICPSVKQWGYGQLKDMNYKGKEIRVSAYGKVFKLGDLYDIFSQYNTRFDEQNKGQDISHVFYTYQDPEMWQYMCPGFALPNAAFDNLSTGRRIHEEDEVFISNPVPDQKKWYTAVRKFFKNNQVGELAIANNKKAILDMLTEWGYNGNDPFYIVAYDRIYDLTSYMGDDIGNNGVPEDQKFLIKEQKNIFDGKKGEDMTKYFEKYKEYDEGKWRQTIQCMDNLFFISNVDHRNDFKCQITNYMMLAASMVIAAVLLVKFLAALQFGSKRKPEEHDKFVICQVPCYTEGEESLAKTIDSLAYLEYDDKRKLIFIISDGMIIGSGNDRPTPRIVLDHMGIDPEIDPEALWYDSIGTGTNQVNMAKVYSGLYEYEGHPVPFIVVVKVGTYRETSRPGNRGKRDSQMILMRYLHNVHHNYPMTPLELELYHQMKNVIGVDPSFYEYILMIDADTEVMQDSLNMLISSMVRDSKIMGICGETRLANEKKSWVTMIQVYEYFISHHLSKAFESLFGSVTCLPGCFCMYRIRTPVKGTPVLITKGIIEDYSECIVDTLHKKNLLSLGEDRYLTTLMLKHFPNLKIKFTKDARCLTNAPETWRVLLSQRRRWINSTVHNLIELLFLNDLCGFLCFSMRTVVFLDLCSTMVQPAMILYLFYLIYCIIFPSEDSIFPWVSLLMLAFTYGLQIIIFILRGAFQHIGWIVIYILAMPIFGMFIPMYSYWHFDDFSWGNTRRILGEKGKVKLVGDEESEELIEDIPKKRWAEYEQELLELAEEEASEVASSSNSLQGAGYEAFQYPQYSQVGAVDSASAYGAGTYVPSEYNYSVNTNNYYAGSVAPSAYGNINMPSRTYDSNEYYNSNRNSFNSSGGKVTDNDIMLEVERFIRTADLMTVTKKKVRQEVSRRLGIDLSNRKEFVDQCIENALNNQ